MEIDLEFTEKSARNTQRWWKLTATITLPAVRLPCKLYRMFVADFSVNSQPILIKFIKDYRDIFMKKYYLIQKLDH